MNSALLESVGQKAAHHQKVIEDFFARNGQEVVAAAGAIADVYRGDGLVGLSTSGNSDNLVKAFVKAKEMGVITIGLAGMSGGEMAKVGLDHCLVVETDSIHRVQECHVIIYHILWDLVHTLLADNRGSLAVSQ